VIEPASRIEPANVLSSCAAAVSRSAWAWSESAAWAAALSIKWRPCRDVGDGAADVDLGAPKHACARTVRPLVTMSWPGSGRYAAGGRSATADGPDAAVGAGCAGGGDRLPESGRGWRSHRERRHMVMLNVEADVVGTDPGRAGSESRRRLHAGAGDQPGAIFELAEWRKRWGSRSCAPAVGRALPDDHHATADTYREQADHNRNNPRCTAPPRRNKSQTEMAAVFQRFTHAAGGPRNARALLRWQDSAASSAWEGRRHPALGGGGRHGQRHRP